MFILAPRPGTKIRHQMMRQRRIFHDDWTKYCGYETTFRPQKMTPEELDRGFWQALRRFYSLPSIIRRLLLPPRRHLAQSLSANLFFHYGVNRHIHPLAYY